MKNKTLLIFPIICLIITSCFRNNKKFIYRFKETREIFEFQSTNEDTIINHSINFWTYELKPNNGDSVSINFIFSEATPNAQKFKSAKLTLFAKNSNNTFTKLNSETETKIEYFDGKGLIKSNLKNNKRDLNEIIDWKKVNYNYEFLKVNYVMVGNVVTYTFFNNYKMNEYSDTLKLKLDLIWENGERSYETMLFKSEYKSAKLNLKY